LLTVDEHLIRKWMINAWFTDKIEEKLRAHALGMLEDHLPAGTRSSNVKEASQGTTVHS
jgi:hypothetical protein